MSRREGLSLPFRILLFCLIPHVWVGVFLIGLAAWTPLLNGCGNDSTAKIVKREFSNFKGPHFWITYRYEEAGQSYTDSEPFRPPASDLQPGLSIAVRSLHWHGHGGSMLQTPDAPSNASFGVLALSAIFWNAFVLLTFVRLGRMLRGGRSTTSVLKYQYRSTVWKRW